MCVLLMTVKQVTEERITWLATFCSIKGKLLNVQSRIAIVTSLSKGIWPGMSTNFIMGIPPQLKWKLRSSMNALKSAVERFSNLLQGYKSMKIVMASFLPFKSLDQFAIFSQMSVNWPFLESFLIFRKVDRTSKVYLYSAVNLDSVEVVCLDPGCMKHFTNVQCLKAHVKTCHQFVTCETCGKKELKKNIKRHLQSHETSSSSEAFECEHKDCSSKFTTVRHFYLFDSMICI